MAVKIPMTWKSPAFAVVSTLVVSAHGQGKVHQGSDLSFYVGIGPVWAEPKIERTVPHGDS